MDLSAEKMRSHAACVTELTCKADDAVCICEEGPPSSTEHCWPRLSAVSGNLLVSQAARLRFFGWTRGFTPCKCGHDEIVGINSVPCLRVGQFHPGKARGFLSLTPFCWQRSLRRFLWVIIGPLGKCVFSLSEHLRVSGASSAYLKGTPSGGTP